MATAPIPAAENRATVTSLQGVAPRPVLSCAVPS